MQDLYKDMDSTLDLSVIERMQTNAPIAVYKKTTVGKVGVLVFNPMTRKPEERILKGDPRDPTRDIENEIVKIYTEDANMYFKNANKRLFERGLIAPFTSEFAEVDMGNAITDDEIDEILSQPNFTLKARLAKFTSPIPVERLHIRALELNKGVKTIEQIKARISELQTEETLEATDKRLKQHYHNLEG